MRGSNLGAWRLHDRRCCRWTCTGHLAVSLVGPIRAQRLTSEQQTGPEASTTIAGTNQLLSANDLHVVAVLVMAIGHRSFASLQRDRMQSRSTHFTFAQPTVTESAST